MTQKKLVHIIVVINIIILSRSD